MHVGIGDFLKGLWDFVQTILRMLSIIKPGLDTAKVGMDIFEAGKKMIDEAPEPKPEQVPERIRASADFLRSYSPVVFADLLFWIFRGFFLLGLFKLWIEWYKVRKLSPWAK